MNEKEFAEIIKLAVEKLKEDSVYQILQNDTEYQYKRNIYLLELDNDIKGISNRKEYIKSLISKTSKPDLIVLPELALCSYMGSTDIWQYLVEFGHPTQRFALSAKPLEDK